MGIQIQVMTTSMDSLGTASHARPARFWPLSNSVNSRANASAFSGACATTALFTGTHQRQQTSMKCDAER